MRTGVLSQDKIIVRANDIIELAGIRKSSSENVIPLNLDGINDIFLVGDLVKIDFEEVLIQITEINDHSVSAEIITGGIIRSNKGISIDRKIDLPPFTQKDLEVIKICNRLNIDTILIPLWPGLIPCDIIEFSFFTGLIKSIAEFDSFIFSFLYFSNFSLSISNELK